jgi:sterol desaturase/sphingolipid hydroxylase (fatty acid hydroxylase superfamily)
MRWLADAAGIGSDRLLAWTLVGFFATLLYGSFAEWLVHRFLMHRNTSVSRRPFALHALLHHRLFGAGASYVSGDPAAQSHIIFPPRDSAALLLAHTLLLIALASLTSTPVAIGGVAAIAFYLLAMNGLHFCFHVRRRRFFERHAWFRWLAAYHRIHHLRQGSNMNLVIPIADLVLGTATLPMRRRGARAVADPGGLVP